ncbi:Single-stranded DNA-binding protein (modular protein) [Candidatus Zixiibacteriota bacterium]|nr:Single-stranded DNA-binding protein (modular protein) [candidate division Zixibacteria bacterium]
MGQARLPYLNKVMMVGNIIRDPELRYTTSNIPVANFRIAANRRYRDGNGVMKDDVCYIGVVAWQSLAEQCVEYLKKGCTVLIEGELKSRSRNENDGTRRSFVEIRAQQIQILNHRDENVTLAEKEGAADPVLAADHEHAISESAPLTSAVVEADAPANNYDYEENSL